MGFKTLVKALVKGSYDFGKTLTDRFGGSSPSDRKVSAVIDAVAGLGFTYFFGASAVNWGIGAALAVTAAVTAPAAIPTALVTVAGAALFGTLGLLGVATGIGFLSAANEKLNILPQKTVDNISGTTRAAVQTVTRPFKLAGAKLGQTFKKAHDGASETPKAVSLQVAPEQLRPFQP